MKSPKYIYLVIPFIKGIALFLILSGLLGIVGCSSNTKSVSGWKPATQIISDKIAKQIIADNSSKDTDGDIYKQLEGIRLTNEFTIFRINSPSFCGYFGCLHIAYLKEKQGKFRLVLKRYINPLLPKKFTQIQLLKEPPNGIVAKSSLPCLRFSQISPLTNTLQQTTECFDGQTYKLVDAKNQVIINN